MEYLNGFCRTKYVGVVWSHQVMICGLHGLFAQIRINLFKSEASWSFSCHNVYKPPGVSVLLFEAPKLHPSWWSPLTLTLTDSYKMFMCAHLKGNERSHLANKRR